MFVSIQIWNSENDHFGKKSHEKQKQQTLMNGCDLELLSDIVWDMLLG